MVSYCIVCSQGLRDLFLLTDKELDKLQPVYFCVNKKCANYGHVIVTRKIDDIKDKAEL